MKKGTCELTQEPFVWLCDDQAKAQMIPPIIAMVNIQ
jgi:hypothetical protein